MAGLYDAADFVPSWAATPAPAPAVVASPADLAPTDYSGGTGLGDQFVRGLRSAYLGGKAGLQGAGSLAAELLGSQGAVDALAEYAAENQRQAALEGPRVRSLRQIAESSSPFSDTANYLAGAAGEMVPYLVLGGVGGMAGRGLAVGRGLRAGTSLAELAPAIEAAGHRGAVASFVPSMVGEQNLAMREQAPDIGLGERMARAVGVGALSAYAGAKIPEALTGVPQAQPFFQGLAKNVGAGAAGMGGMDVIGQAHRMTYDPSYEFNPEQTLDAAATGAAGMLPYAAPHALAGRMAMDVNGMAGKAKEQLTAGMEWLGTEAYDRLPEPVRKLADVVADGGQATLDMIEAAKPHVEKYGQAAQRVLDMAVDSYNERTKGMDGDTALEKLTKRYVGATEAATTLATGAHRIGGKIVESIFSEEKDVPNEAKAFVGKARDTGEALERVADALDNPTKWLAENEQVTVKMLKGLNQIKNNPATRRKYIEGVLDYVDEVGADVPAAQELRQYAEAMRQGTLSEEAAHTLWAKAKLAAGAARTVEALQKLTDFKGVRLSAEGKNVSMEALSRQRDVVNKAVRDALANAKTDPELAQSIAARIQTRDVLESGADKVVREAVSSALTDRGINPKANSTFTDMYDRVLKAVNEKVEGLRQEGVLPERSAKAGEVPEAFKQDTRAIFDELFSSTEAGQQIKANPPLAEKSLDGLVDYMTKLADGTFGDGAAVKLKTTLERVFGKNEQVAGAVERLIDAASVAYGGLGKPEAERVHALANLGKSMAERTAQIKKLTHEDVDVNQLLDDISTARDYDSRRADLPADLRKLRAEAKAMPAGSDRRYRIETKLQDAVRNGLMDDNATGFRLLKQKWVKDGTVKARDFEKLVDVLEAYENSPDRLTRPEKHVVDGHEDAAGREGERNKRDEENTDDEGAEDPINQFDVDGKRNGDEYQQYLEDRREAALGVQGEEQTVAKPIFGGADRQNPGKHTADTLGAPVSKYATGDFSRNNAPGDEYNNLVAEMHSMYGNRAARGRGVRVADWANEVAGDKTPRQLMNEAMQALLEHDQARLSKETLTDKDKEWIGRRAKLAESLGNRGDAGEQFFAHPMNRHYRYYRMEADDGKVIGYSAEQLRATAPYELRGTFSDPARLENAKARWAERMAKADGGIFPESVYHDSLMTLKDADGKSFVVDIPSLVSAALRRHQASETIGAGEKKQARNIKDDLAAAFHNVMAGLMTADGMHKEDVLGDKSYSGDRMLMSDDKTKWAGSVEKHGDRNLHIDPQLVVFRDPVGNMKQGGEHVESHSVQRAFRLSQLTGTKGVDIETLKTLRDNPKQNALTSADIAQIVRTPGRRDNGKDAAKAGIAYSPEGSVDMHALLARKLEHEGADASEALHRDNVPPKMAGMLLREALIELKAKAGISDDIFQVDKAGNILIDGKYDDVVVYYRRFGETESPVTLGELKKTIINPSANAPRTLREAKIEDGIDRLRQALSARDKYDADMRSASDEKLRQSDFKNKGDVTEARLTSAYDRTDFDRSDLDLDHSGSRWRGRVDDEGRVYKEREKSGENKYATDEGENMHIQQVLEELGEAAQGDTPLFDKTEAYGGSRSVNENYYLRRSTLKNDFLTDEFEGPRAPRPTREANLEAAFKEIEARDPSLAALARKIATRNKAREDVDAKREALETLEKAVAEGRALSASQQARLEKLRRLKPVGKDETGLVSEPSTNVSTTPYARGEDVKADKMTVEPLPAERGPDRVREDARVAARAALRDEPSFSTPEARDAYEAGRAAPAPAPEVKAAAPEAKEASAAFDYNTPAKGANHTMRVLNEMTDTQVRDFLLNLPAKPAKGSLGEQAKNFVANSPAALKQLERAGLERDPRGGVRAATDNPFSRQRTLETPAEGAPSRDELQAKVDKLLGDGTVKLEMPFEITDANGKPVSGKYDGKLKQILVSALAADREGTAHHEAWHRVEDLLKSMGENGQRVLDEIHAYVSSPAMAKWLTKHYGDDAEVMGQLKESASERASFTFQKVMEGMRLPQNTRATTVFEKLKNWVRAVAAKLGFETTTQRDRANSFMRYVKDGGFARDLENDIAVRKGMGEKNGDRILHTVAKTIAPAFEGLEKLLGHTSERVHKLGVSEYSQIVGLFGGESGKGGWLVDKHHFENKLGNMVADHLGNKTVEQRIAYVKAGKFDPVIKAVTKYMEDAGVDANGRMKVFDKTDVFNIDKINDNFPEFVNDLVAYGGFKGKSGDARILADRIAREGISPGETLFENKPEIARKWKERDPFERNLKLVHYAVKVAESTRSFGKMKQYVGEDGKKYWQHEKLHDLLEAGDAKAGAEGRELIRDYIDAMHGNYGGKLSPAMRKLQSTLMFAQNVHALPLAVFSQMLEPMQIALRKNHLGGSLDALFRGVRDLPRSFDFINKHVAPDYWEKLSYQIGTAPQRIIAGTMSELMNGDHIGGTVGKLNDQFFRLNGMDQWNRSMHIEATKHAVEFLREHAENVVKKRGATDSDGTLRSARFLKELNVEPADIKFDGDGRLILNDKNERAIVQFVEEALAHPDAGSNALWMNDPRFALLAQMKRFTFAHARFVLSRGMKEMKLGNMFPVAPAIIAMPWMMAADGLRDFVKGTNGYQTKSAWDYAKHIMERTGHFGRAQFPLDAVDAVGRGGSPVEALAGPTAEMFGDIARGAHNGKLLDAMMGYLPGAGAINTVI